MHVLIYSDDPGIGGVAQFDHMFSLGLRAAGFRVSLAQTRQDNPRAAERIQAGVEHCWFDYDTVADFPRTFVRVDEAAALIGRLRPDFILFSDSCPVSNFAGKQAAQALNVPFAARVGFVAPYLAENFAAHLPKLGALYDCAKAVVAVSQENLRLMERLFRLPPERGRVIYSGKNPAFFQPADPVERRARRERLGMPEDGVLCFTAARLEMVKGYQHQLAAIETLRGDPSWSRLFFAWAGPGSLQGDLEKIIAMRGLGGKVHLLGQCWDVPAWLDAADVFVLPAHAEGLPQAVMEAMAKRLPVVSTHVSGIPEALGDTGVLLPDPQTDPKGTEAGLARHIAALAANPDLRRAMGEACFRRADRLFHAERMVADYIALIVAPSAPASPASVSPAEVVRRLAKTAALPAPGEPVLFRSRLADAADAAALRPLAGLWTAYRDELATLAAGLAESRRIADRLGLKPSLGDLDAELIYLLIRVLQPELVCDIDDDMGGAGGWGETAAVALAALARNGRGRVETFVGRETIAGLPAETALRCALPPGCDAARHRLTIGDPRRTVAARLGAQPSALLSPDLTLITPQSDDAAAEWLVKTLFPRLNGPILLRGVMRGDSRPVDTAAALYVLSFLHHAGVRPAVFAACEPHIDRSGLAARHPVASSAALLGAPAAVNRETAAARQAALLRLLDGGAPDPAFPLISERLRPGSLKACVWTPAMPPEDRYVAATRAGVLERARIGVGELALLAGLVRANPAALPAGLLDELAARAFAPPPDGFDPACAVALLETAVQAGAAAAVAALLRGFAAAPPPPGELAERVARIAAAGRTNKD